MPRPNPQFNTPLSPSQINAELPFYPLYGVTPDNKYTPIAIDENGQLSIGAVTITGPVTVSDVVIKGVDPDNSFATEDYSVYNLGSGNGFAMRSTLFDGGNHLKINADGSLDVNVTSADVVTANQGIPTSLIDAWPIKPTDGINSQSFTAFGEAEVTITQPLPSGTNLIGHIISDSGSTTVITGDVTVVQPLGTNLHAVVDSGSITVANATLAVTQSGTWNINNISGTISLPTGAATETTLVAIKTDTDKFTFVSSRLLVDGSGVTQPVSGTVTANIGTTNGLALDSTLTNNSQKSQVINSSGVSVDARPIGGTPIDTDVGLITNSIIYGHTTAGGGSYVEVKVTPSGALTADVSGSSVSASQSGTWNINNISGTISLPSGASTSANQINGSQKTQLVDGSGNVIASTSNSLNVDVTNTVPVTLTSTTITGTVAVTQSTSPWVISGTVTANAGTGTFIVGQTIGTNLHTVLDSGTLTSITNALPTGSNTIGAVTQASGPWTSNITQIASSSIAIAATGIAKVGVTDGTGNAITSSSTNGDQALDIAVSMSADGLAAFDNTVFTTSYTFNLPTNGTESLAMYLKNPNASGKTLVIKRVHVAPITATNAQATIRVYSNPTTSANGTSQTATTTSVGSGVTAVATPFSGPTASANGAQLYAFTISAAADGGVNNVINIDGLIRIAANNTLLITGNPTTNNFNLTWTIMWQEV